ncbi:hypothetical protein NDU88_005536 [Pleurodeles waltl]|uniref:Uncharacterized protein n=1 Tax=Pleurodeles waltl TaxID=8319 RepID=A0AAV7MCD9_PLEWA|nr:hypothetical protein NDU88_005536 [Pleurodeles waltl]
MAAPAPLRSEAVLSAPCCPHPSTRLAQQGRRRPHHTAGPPAGALGFQAPVGREGKDAQITMSAASSIDGGPQESVSLPPPRLLLTTLLVSDLPAQFTDLRGCLLPAPEAGVCHSVGAHTASTGRHPSWKSPPVSKIPRCRRDASDGRRVGRLAPCQPPMAELREDAPK